ncbi:hypothetical protein FGG08_006586 [Glutinoglossum americanum]|uniref:Uncharacterized protein n=1 Tax=Glutinoglossum americanum TaxID=1670608 RepID=A0A9P8I729_9PEZI|nr:hypothetical protein FGG08_006586 [Glutinoglossum americanum]
MASRRHHLYKLIDNDIGIYPGLGLWTMQRGAAPGVYDFLAISNAYNDRRGDSGRDCGPGGGDNKHDHDSKADNGAVGERAYPTRYLTYPYDFMAYGTLQTTASDGAKGCLTVPDHTWLSLPSHPPWTEPLPTDFPKDGDDVGTDFLPQWHDGPFVDGLFPDFGPFQTCNLYYVAPAQALVIATVLTETSTSYKDSDTAIVPSKAPKETVSSPPPPGSTPAPQPPPPDSAKPSPPPDSGPSPATAANQVATPYPVSNSNLSPITTGNQIATPNQSPGNSPPPLTVGNQIITPDSSSRYVVGTQTLLPGGPAITISGTPIDYPAAPAAPAAPLLTVGNQVITPDSSSRYIVGAQTLFPGGPAITISGTPINYPNAAPLLTIGNQVITPDSSSRYIVGTQTLFPGGPAITISGTPINYPTALASPLTIGNQIITPDSLAHYIIGSQTLIPGGPGITVSGTPISLKPGGTDVVVGATTMGLGDLIFSGLGGIVNPPAVTVTVDRHATPPKGGSGGFNSERRLGVLLAGICICALVNMVVCI